MTIPTPTSNDREGLSGNAPPPGIPDEATLGRLATEFFRRLPGAAAPSADALPAAAGGSPAPAAAPDAAPGFAEFAQFKEPGEAATGAPVPARQTSQAKQTSQTSQTTQTSPAPTPPEGRPVEFGVPEAYAAALPSATSFPASPQALEHAPLSPPSSPFYFLGEASAYTTNASAPEAKEDRVIARSYGLPGEDELKRLLDGILTARDPLEGNRAADSAGNFYFIDNAHVPHAAGNARPPFDVNAVRRDFPILGERVNGKPLVWFDNAATTQKPQSVIDRLAYFYAHENSNIHRAAHELAARATDAYEAARGKVQRFIGAGSADEIIFVRGASEAINLVAKTWGVQNIGEGDEIIVSLLEHHANIVPWQQLVAQTGAKLRVIPVDDSGQIKLDEYQRLLNGRTKLVSITQVSNALGTVTPVKSIIDAAHAAGAKVLVDGAQSVSHLRVNVQALDADFFVFSGHKIFGPTGIGVVYGKQALLESMPPWQGGGNMIADVTFERTLYQPAPNKFEAGTGNIADAVGLGAALDYVDRIGLENIARYEHGLLTYAMHGLGAIPGVRLIGTATDKASVASFVLAGYQPEEVGKALNQEGIAVRSGHHCAQPILRRFGVEATVRPSLAFYNTCEEIDRLLSVVRRLAQAKRGAVR